jgi:hypothetical protein
MLTESCSERCDFCCNTYRGAMLPMVARLTHTCTVLRGIMTCPTTYRASRDLRFRCIKLSPRHSACSIPTKNNHKKPPIPLQETSSCQQALAAIQRQAQVERQFFLSPLPQQNLTPKRYQLFSSNISKMIKRWQILFKMHGSKSMLLVRKPNRSPG